MPTEQELLEKLIGKSAAEHEPENEFEQMLYAREVEVQSLEDLKEQRGTSIPALFNQFYKFIQNPSTVSVETFKRMIDTDDTIGSGVDFLTTCLAARLGRYQHESTEVTEFVNEALDQIQGGFEESLKELLSATWAGFSVMEQVWDNNDLGTVITKLVPMPHQTILFETERTGELTRDGILQYQRNYNPFMLGGGLNFYSGGFSATIGYPFGNKPDPLAKLGDMPFPLRTANSFNYLSIRIPVAKCMHYAFNAQGKMGNPYGRSLLRRAYKYYVMKDAILGMLSTALDRKGTPLTLVYADPMTTLEDVTRNPTGANARGQTGKGIRADAAARNAFKNMSNDSVIILPGKKGEIYEVDPLSQQSNAADFISALDFCNKSIMRALLLPSLVFTGGDGAGSYALGQEHAKTFDKILDSINAGLEQTLIQQMVARLIRMNFPESVYKKDGFGSFGKRELSQDEISKEMEAIEKAVNMGAIDMNDLKDLNEIRAKVKFQPRDTVIEREPIPGMEGEEESEEQDDGSERE